MLCQRNAAMSGARLCKVVGWDATVVPANWSWFSQVIVGQRKILVGKARRAARWQGPAQSSAGSVWMLKAEFPSSESRVDFVLLLQPAISLN